MTTNVQEVIKFADVTGTCTVGGQFMSQYERLLWQKYQRIISIEPTITSFDITSLSTIDRVLFRQIQQKYGNLQALSQLPFAEDRAISTPCNVGPPRRAIACHPFIY